MARIELRTVQRLSGKQKIKLLIGLIVCVTLIYLVSLYFYKCSVVKQDYLEVCKSHPIKNVSVSVWLPLTDEVYYATIKSSNFSDLSVKEKFALQSDLINIEQASIKYISDGDTYYVNSDMLAILKNGESVYDDYENSPEGRQVYGPSWMSKTPDEMTAEEYAEFEEYIKTEVAPKLE